ncbi:MAG: aminotransferase class V-fold PLP-dependent enzyme [Acidimicrobiia bacterium]|nr:aminotransferase class V-fold PLP-dependent enzyme [Acidimicrobiia bacterium]
MQLDVKLAREHFPAFTVPALEGWAFFDNAGGSYACQQTIDALTRYYVETKLQPYSPGPASAAAGEAMDRSHIRWAEALGVKTDEVHFGPSTSQNTYVLAHAFADVLGAGDEIIVTNQDHEANTGAVRRMAERVGATLREWRIDPASGLLDPEGLAALLTDRTKLVTFPHCSNVVGQENDVAPLARLAHDAGARVIVDAVSYAPHAIPDVSALDADVYLFSLYKVYSVHQGLMVVRNGLIEELPNQGHFFNADQPGKRLTPAGPDHAQIAAAGSVLDYVEALDAAHGASSTDLRAAAAKVTRLWQDHESALLEPVLDYLSAADGVRLIGPASIDSLPGHRCPTVAFVPIGRDPAEVVRRLTEYKIMASSGHFYAYRVLEGLDIDVNRGLVRLSWVHYTTTDEIDQLIRAISSVLAT